VAVCGWAEGARTNLWGEKIAGRVLDILHILEQLWRYKPDILLVISTLDDKALLRDNLLLLASRGLKRPMVVQFHGSRLDAIGQPGQPIFKAAARLLFSLCEGVIVSSQQERQVLSRFAPRQRFFVADNIYYPGFCTPSAQVPPGWNLPKDRPIVFFAARLIPEKGVLDLLSAIPMVLKETLAISCWLESALWKLKCRSVFPSLLGKDTPVGWVIWIGPT